MSTLQQSRVLRCCLLRFQLSKNNSKVKKLKWKRSRCLLLKSNKSWRRSPSSTKRLTKRGLGSTMSC